MSQQPGDQLDFTAPAAGRPAALNVLTILTFIGCGMQLIGVFLTKWVMRFMVTLMDDPARWETLTSKEKDRFYQARQALELYEQYFWPLTIIGLTGIALCFVGAMQMRRLKKQGFYLYVAGQFAPIIASAALVGLSVQSNSPLSAIISLIVPAVFTVLYAMQLKYMK